MSIIYLGNDEFKIIFNNKELILTKEELEELKSISSDFNNENNNNTFNLGV